MCIRDRCWSSGPIPLCIGRRGPDMTSTAEAGKGRSSREDAPPAARETPPRICYPDVVSDRPHIDNDAADDLDATCDLAEFEVREVSPQRTATRLLRESSRVVVDM